jgi:ethanolamine utilization protein EutA
MTSVPNEIHFTAAARNIAEEDRIELTSVGVDIGSSTCHIIFSRLALERQGNRYHTVERRVLYESPILLTPYLDDATIDGTALGHFISEQYDAAGLQRDQVDTGALILTGVALQRRNSRAIGDLFSQEAGRFVVVSAGDGLEATLAAYGSGATLLSLQGYDTVLNVDIGGGTSKFAICQQGEVKEVVAVDVGARLLVLDGQNTLVRVEEAGRRIGQELGLDLQAGGRVEQGHLKALASYMADRLTEVMKLGALSPEGKALLRTQPFNYDGRVDAITFSGGVSEFIYNREGSSFGDLGRLLADEVRERVHQMSPSVVEPVAGIRATVIGASQYTVQLSGNTIFISPLEALPIRNVVVVSPVLDLSPEEIDPGMVKQAITAAMQRLDLLESEAPLAIGVRWKGSASFGRIDALCSATVNALANNLNHDKPLILVCDGDVGGLLGIHLKQEIRLPNPVISIDGIELKEFDYIDIGSIIPSSGAVPVVVKSLVFPAITNQATA